MLGSIFAAIAYQNGPPSIIAAFDYSYLIFSAVLGFFIFSENLDSFTIAGMILIVIAGIISSRQPH